MGIESMIPKGKNNAVKASVLAEMLNIGERDVSRLIQAERKEGTLICSCSEGFYLPENREEILSFYRMMERQAISRFETLKNFKRELDKCDGQEVLPV